MWLNRQLPIRNGATVKNGMNEDASGANDVLSDVKTDETEDMTEEMITGVMVKTKVIMEIAAMKIAVA